MKKIFGILLTTIATATIFVACEKNQQRFIESVYLPGQAQFKVNFFSSYRNNPGYQIKLNGTRVSNILTYATPYPGGGLNTGGGSYADYLSVAPGNVKVDITIPNAGTNLDSVTLASSTVALTADKTFSLYFADTATNTQAVLVEENLTVPDSGFAKFRFINLIPDLPSADLYFGTTKVASAIPYKGISPEFTVAINTGTAWSFRAAGGTTDLATYSSSSSVSNKRVYTAVARGYNSITTTTDPRRRSLSFVYNR